MDRDRGCSELYREVGAGERREGAAGCSIDVIRGDSEACATQSRIWII